MNSQEFSRFYRDNIEKVYRFILLKVNSSELAQDLTSETFMRTWKYTGDKNVPVKNTRALAYRIARNLIIDWYRRKDSQVLSLDDPVIELALHHPHTDISPEYELAMKSDIENIRKAVALLRPEHGEAILLHYLNDLSIREIAEVFEESEGTIRVWLHRGLRELREKLI